MQWAFLGILHHHPQKSPDPVCLRIPPCWGNTLPRRISMSHGRLTVLTAAFAATLLLVAAHPAAAQNTVNQTTCGGATGVPNCLTNGFLQDLTVVCAGQGIELGKAL